MSVSVRLISTQDGHVLWTSQDFERPVANAYELQDAISCNIAIELRTELCDTFPKRNTDNAEAYQAYLKGRFHWNKRTAEGIRRSMSFTNRLLPLTQTTGLLTRVWQKAMCKAYGMCRLLQKKFCLKPKKRHSKPSNWMTLRRKPTRPWQVFIH